MLLFPPFTFALKFSFFALSLIYLISYVIFFPFRCICLNLSCIYVSIYLFPLFVVSALLPTSFSVACLFATLIFLYFICLFISSFSLFPFSHFTHNSSSLFLSSYILCKSQKSNNFRTPQILRQNDYAHVFAKRKLPLANIFQDKKFACVFTEGLVWQIFARISV